MTQPARAYLRQLRVEKCTCIKRSNAGRFIRLYGQLSEPYEGGNEVYHCQETAGCFIIARGQAAKLLEAAEKAFDFVAVAVQVAVNHALHEAILFAGDDDLCAQGFNGRYHRVYIVGFIRQPVARPFGARQ
nr:hypothetical protein [Hymenobacter terrestris]